MVRVRLPAAPLSADHGAMHFLLRPLDWMAEWLGDHLSPQAQLRVGIGCVLASLPFYAYWPVSGEKPGVYFMSALALSLSGIAFVVGAEVLMAQEKQDAEQREKLDRILGLLDNTSWRSPTAEAPGPNPGQ